MTRSHVRRLTLRAGDEASVRAGAILVEDALRIATLPHDRDPRLYLLRRFDIGAFELGAGSHAISREIERRIAEVVWTAVPATSEHAHDAPAVWFADPVVAIAELARRLVTGPPPVEWFWPHVARGASHAVPRSQALRACLAAAAHTAPGAVAVALVADAMERARAGVLLGDLQPAEAARLLAVTFGGPCPTSPVRGGGEPVGVLAPRWAERLAIWAPRWRGDARATWLAAIGAIATRGAIGSIDVEIAEAQHQVAAVLRAAAPEQDGDPAPARADPVAGGGRRIPSAAHGAGPGSDAPARAAAQAPAVLAARPDRPVEPARLDAPAVHEAPPARATVPAGDRPPARRAPIIEPAGDGLPARRAPIIEPAARRGAPGRVAAPDELAAVASRWTPAGGEPTAAAGVLFLLRPLAMLGLAEWLDRHRWAADAGFGAHLLASIAAAHAPADDPLVQLAAGDPPDGAFAAPASWRALIGHRPLQLRPLAGGRMLEASGRLPVAAWTERRPPGLEAFLDRPVRRGAAAPRAPWALVAWRRAVERWSRRFARLGCAEIVRRRAMLIATPTHLDLRMALSDADVRIRIAGLDVDPGWVPWLGRVVSFHYA